MPSKVKARFSAPLLLALLCAAIALSVKTVLAFSLQDYEGGFELGQWNASLQGDYEYENQNSSSPNSSLSSTRNRFDEVMKINNNGIYLIDPRLLTGDAGLNLDLYQEQDRFSHANSTSMDGLLWGYNLDTTLFSQSPENINVYANQNQGVSNSAFGGRTTADSSNYGLLAQVLEDSVLKDHGIYYFSSRLSVRQEQFDEKTTQLDSTFKLDQTRDIVDYVAEKGFQTADLRFHYEFDNEHDGGDYHLAFQTQNFNLHYDKDFGANLNRHWDSDINYYDRTGTGGQQRFLFVNQRLRIDHYENLFSTYQYQLQNNDDQQQGSTTYQYGLFELNHRLYQNVTQILDLGGTRQTVTGGNITNYWIGLSNDYTHKLPLQGIFFLDTLGQYEIQENNVSSGLIPVIDESHPAPQNDTPFTLDNTFVLTNTIVVIDTKGGTTRLPTTRNIDYDVIQLGNLTQIKRIPTSLVINAGDSLVVSYTYEVPANARFSTTTKAVSVGVTFPWVDFAYSYQAINQTLLSGQGAQFLVDQTTNTFTLGLHHEWETILARANASYETERSSTISFNMTDLSQNVAYHAPWSLLLSASGDETFTEYILPKHRSKSYALTLNGDRPFWGGGTLSTFATLREIEDSGFPTQKEADAGMRLNYIIGQLRISPSLLWYDRTWGSVKSDDLRFELRITRFFN